MIVTVFVGVDVFLCIYWWVVMAVVLSVSALILGKKRGSPAVGYCTVTEASSYILLLRGFVLCCVVL